MQSPFIVEITEHNFRETLEGSMNTPVLIHFWANAQPESAQILPELQTLAQQYNGAFTLALLNCEDQPALASQFGVQVLPTIALFVNGQAVDGLGGPQPIDAIATMLQKHLPSPDEQLLKQIMELLQEGQHAEALSIIHTLPAELQSRGDVKLATADCLLETKQFDIAQELLGSIPLEYQDNYYKGLLAKLELHLQAADSPELQRLEQEYEANTENLDLACELAIQYNQVGRDEEALELLWNILKVNLGAQDGEVKKTFMDILSALGQGNALAGKYRRQLYSILY
ncbi:COG3118 Thioredoxin domain-containing protein [Vibrio sp. B1FLJ16]|uniref:co-chaperone YbbN n=1 Tax=Vibrio sp. B1FLJ16 TaxID=2751178 RepID=UPI0015F75B81|nr:co-chaperone YbbN [Vibrio sp. B1FLJ16]CAD7801378.1 COG3118 Thioredoxin domain-containing protein [Vibrio sp. B1FLJ16]CAE6889971.1 COG3118 Thioredoxin domain-containing protein [Vibrio sp. B1FLJ16]